MTRTDPSSIPAVVVYALAAVPLIASFAVQTVTGQWLRTYGLVKISILMSSLLAHVSGLLSTFASQGQKARRERRAQAQQADAFQEHRGLVLEHYDTLDKIRREKIRSYSILPGAGGEDGDKTPEGKSDRSGESTEQDENSHTEHSGIDSRAENAEVNGHHTGVTSPAENDDDEGMGSIGEDLQKAKKEVSKEENQDEDMGLQRTDSPVNEANDGQSGEYHLTVKQETEKQKALIRDLIESSVRLEAIARR